MPPRPPPPTHFLCIPLVTGASRPQLAASLGSFKADVTSPDGFGVPEQAVRPVGTIHLTLGVMSFPPRNGNGSGSGSGSGEEEGLEKAVSLLKTLAPRQILSGVRNNDNNSTGTGPAPAPLSVTLRGLRSMQPAPRASVLYAAPADPDGTLLRFCEALRSAFREAGLMAAEGGRPLLLHATIVNTVHVRGGDRRRGGKGNNNSSSRGRLTVDARGIVDRYGDFVWMEDVAVEKIAICRMGAKKTEDGDAAYEVEAEIDFA